MRPIIINVDYKHNPNKIYNISNNGHTKKQDSKYSKQKHRTKL